MSDPMTEPTPEQRAYADWIGEALADGLTSQQAVVYAGEMSKTRAHAMRVLHYAVADFNESVGLAWRGAVERLKSGLNL